MHAGCGLASTVEGQAADRAAAGLLAPHNNRTGSNRRLYRSSVLQHTNHSHASYINEASITE